MELSFDQVVDQFINSRIAASCLIAWFISQLLKSIIYTVATREISFKYYITGQGGMPSTHSALVCALFVSVFLDEGFSNTFAVAFAFGAVTLRDALGVRQATSHHAKILNLLIDRMIEPGTEQYTTLKELVGHTFTEVAAGIIIGFVSVIFTFYFIF